MTSMQAAGLEILLDDDCLLAINKPSGLPTQAPRQFDSVERRIRAWFAARQAEQAGGTTASDDRPPYLGLPHRLDRPATGILLLAKTPRAARLVSRQFERRQIEKTYWALVGGTVDPPQGAWRDYVRKLPSVPKVEIVSADAPGALEAVLHYQVLGQTPFGSWLEIKLQTGRTHQIRIQTASRGHPVLGDQLYGSTAPFGTSVTDQREGAIALHARSLIFRHPTTQESCTVTAYVPSAWRLCCAPPGE
jgi:23S rRNA pseudouridine1911/1915/1917 synthase